MKMGLVSIITPAYNGETFIAETIRSVQAQTYESWEMIIADDCSADRTADIVTAMAAEDPRIRYVCLEQNGGPAAARNAAMEHAEGEYMAFLDSDDLWVPDKLERQLAFMTEHGFPFAFTSFEQVDEQGERLNIVKRSVDKVDYETLLLDNIIGNSTVMYSVAELGKFTVPPIRKRNDYALWLKILKATPYAYGMPDILSQYRIRSNSVSRNKLSLLKFQWLLYHGVEGLPFFKSLYLVARQCWLKVFGK